MVHKYNTQRMRYATKFHDQYTTIVRLKTAQIVLTVPKPLARKTNIINYMR